MNLYHADRNSGEERQVHRHRQRGHGVHSDETRHEEANCGVNAHFLGELSSLFELRRVDVCCGMGVGVVEGNDQIVYGGILLLTGPELGPVLYYSLYLRFDIARNELWLEGRK